MTESLAGLIAKNLASPVPEPVAALAEHVRKHHSKVRAVLAYGSALRDSAPANTLIDLYILTESSAGVSASGFSRLACRIVPPNVHYAECQHGGLSYRGKYAVLPLPLLQHKVSRSTANPYFWARFAQPCRLVWADGDESRSAITAIVETACRTACANAKGTAPNSGAREQWAELFRQTYRTELRPEGADRAALIVEANLGFYTAVSEACSGDRPVTPVWALRRMEGKLLSALRLVKAAFTFQGGADYVAWKIKRHSGVDVPLTEFQRRHPLLAAITLLPKLLRKGAVR